MINRILIRVKVVQLLYSFLLTEKQFALEPQPTPPTREKRFSYKVYLDTLTLMESISKNVRKGKECPLADDNPFIKALNSDDILKAHKIKDESSEQFPFLGCVESLVETIKESGIYKQYLKTRATDSNAGVKVWRDIFNIIIWPDHQYNMLAKRIPNYSLSGMDRMKDLIESTFVGFMSSNSDTAAIRKELGKSLAQARELYFRFLMIPVAITQLRDEEIAFNRNKNFPTADDLNPNMALSDNLLVDNLKNNAMLMAYAEEHKLSLLDTDRMLIKHLLDKIMGSELYAAYSSARRSDDKQEQLVADSEFWKQAMRTLIYSDEDLLENLEAESVFWNDDVDIMGEFVIKTFRRIEEGMGQNAILPMYKDSEDAMFGIQLAEAVLKNKNEYRAMVDDCLRKDIWDSERLAFMDVVILLTAIAEMLNFPKIPLRATINEYIEMAKAYSTPKSGVFVHGFLAEIIKKLQASGQLLKKA